MIVLDSSAAVDYLLARGLGEWVEMQLEDADGVHAPHLIDVEVVGALRKRVQGGDLTARRAEAALSDFQYLNVRRYAHRLFRRPMWDLRENIAASDAAYVTLAGALGVPLVTTDLRLARAPGLTIEIRTPPDEEL